MGPHLRLRNWLSVAALAIAAAATALIDPQAFGGWPRLLIAVILPYAGYLVAVRSLPGSIFTGVALGTATVWSQVLAALSWDTGGLAELAYLPLVVYAPLGVMAVMLVELMVWLWLRRGGEGDGAYHGHP
jgi:hypothetical protein